MIRMQIDLSLIGMEKGRQYETVITTENCEKIKNAAPIGVLCSGQDMILNRIFKGSHTLENIISQRKFIVNITHDPEIFMLSTIGNLSEDYFNEDNSLKCAEAYFKCEVISLSEAVKQSDPIRKKEEAIVIKSKVTDLIDMVGEEQKEEYLNRFREAFRVVKKVGYKEDIKSMKIIKEELRKKGYEP